MSAPKWWGKVACWLAGRHNLLDVELPPGWTVQDCRTCGEPVEAFGRGGSQRYREQRKPAAEERP